MANLYAHGKNFVDRLGWLSPLMGGVVPTAQYLVRARGNPLVIGEACHNGFDFEFRNCDSTAVKEVLVDAEYAFLVEYLKSCQAPLIVDVGAHIGTFSLWVYQQNPRTQFLMVEANPASHDILTRNIKRNITQDQWQSLNKAAWKNNDALSFATAGDSMGNKVSANGDISVEGITFGEIIDGALSGRSKIDLMKIDIEGAEEAFFEGAEALEKVERLVIELHPKLCDTDAVRAILSARYNIISEVQNRIDDKPVLYCRND